MPFKTTGEITTTIYIVKPSDHIDKQIAELNDWRGKTLAYFRKIIHEADPEIVEEWKWMGSPCWSHDGLICVANAHKNKVKITFPQGTGLPDPNKLFNADLNGKKWRAIDLHEGDEIEENPMKELIKSALSLNIAKKVTK